MRSTVGLGLVLVALTALTFWSVQHFDFVSLDDPAYVTDNRLVAQGLTGTAIAAAFTTTASANWHPLTWLSHMLDVELFGMDAGAHHLMNLLIHLANVVLLFALLRRLTGAAIASAFVAALFAVHPLHVESVAWISERKDVLSTLLMLLTLWAYASYVQRPRAGRYLVTLALFALGLMAKPMLVTLPFVMLLLDWWPLQRPERLQRRITEKIPFIVLSAASCVITLLVQRAYGATRGQELYSLDVRSANALRSSMAYLGDTFWPSGLSAFYPFHTPVPTATILLAIVLLGGLSALAFIGARRVPAVLVGWLWFLGTLVPVIGLVQVGGQARADRYTYIPLVGLFIAVVWGVKALVDRRSAIARAVVLGAVAVVLMLAVTARAQVQHWRDSRALWQHALDVDPANYRAHAALGVLLDRERGETLAAMVHLRESIRLQPDFAEAHQNLARMLARDGHFADAVPEFADVVRLQPASADAHSDLGQALSDAGRQEDAVRELREAARLDPASGRIQNNLGSALARAGLIADALPHFAEAAQRMPDDEQAHMNLAVALAQTGRFRDAARAFADVLRINPRNQQARAAAAELVGRQ